MTDTPEVSIKKGVCKVFTTVICYNIVIHKKKETQNRIPKVLWSSLLAYFRTHVVSCWKSMPKVLHLTKHGENPSQTVNSLGNFLWSEPQQGWMYTHLPVTRGRRRAKQPAAIAIVPLRGP